MKQTQIHISRIALNDLVELKELKQRYAASGSGVVRRQKSTANTPVRSNIHCNRSSRSELSSSIQVGVVQGIARPLSAMSVSCAPEPSSQKKALLRIYNNNYKEFPKRTINNLFSFNRHNHSADQQKREGNGRTDERVVGRQFFLHLKLDNDRETGINQSVKISEHKHLASQYRRPSKSFKGERGKKRKDSEVISPWDFNYNDEIKS